MPTKQIKRLIKFINRRYIQETGMFVALISAVIVAIISLTVYIEGHGRDNIHRKAKLDSLQALTIIRSDLDRELNKSLFQLGALAAYISANPEIDRKEFNIFTQNLFRQESHIISLGAAPDMVIKYVYPYEENKSVLGHDYRDLESQRELAFLAKETGQQVMAGPLTSLQGGYVLIARAPVFLPEDSGDKVFWGLVSVLIDAEELLVSAGMENETYDISIRGKDAKGQYGEVFYGNPASFNGKNITLSVTVPGGSWQLSAVLSSGVLDLMSGEIVMVRLVGLFLCLAVLIFMSFRLRYSREQKLVEKKLSRALIDAEQANRVKSEFLANMSHELRTPLNAIIGFSDLITSVTGKAASEDKVDEYARDINISGHHLLKIINEILDLSKVESGNFIATIETVYIQDTAENALRMMRNQIAKGKLKTIIKIPDDLPPIQSDERMIKQIFYNLLNNSIKFTPEGGTITLSAEVQKDGRMKIIFTDTGVGMSQEDLLVAMQAFGQTVSYLARSQQGTGLGLPLVKAFVELLDGEFYIQSEVRVGTEITLIF